jgi:tetratricopeptide (TPR) repeat protein
MARVADLCYSQGQDGDAEALYRRALEIGEKTLGPDHEDVANSLNNLAALLARGGRYTEAVR